MTVSKRSGFSILYTLLIIFAFWGTAWGAALTPVQEQEYLDARESINVARTAQAEKYAADPLKKAVDFLNQADSSRAAKGSEPFTQAVRLARAYAELAEAQAELNREKENLATTEEELRKVKAEIERLKNQ